MLHRLTRNETHILTQQHVPTCFGFDSRRLHHFSSALRAKASLPSSIAPTTCKPVPFRIGDPNPCHDYYPRWSSAAIKAGVNVVELEVKRARLSLLDSQSRRD